MSSVHDGNELGDLNENPDLAQAWNSENMKQLRRNMLKGQKSSICSNCYEHERIGKNSERQQYNKDYKKYFSRIGITAADGSLSELDIPIIDIRFSNKCNYKCRICNSDYSTLWYDEEIKLGKNPNAANKEIKVALNDTLFWESFDHLLPGVKRLHFAGGEPLFMDEHYRVLDRLIAMNKTDVVLSYNTNLSTLRYKKYDIVDLWNKFDRVEIWASLDGMGTRGDYQRKGQKWETIESNILRIQKECRSVLLGVNITVSILNVLHIQHFYRHLRENGLAASDRVNLYPLYYPHYFCINQLTPSLKTKVAREFKEFENNYLSGISDTARIKNNLRALVSLMNSKKGSMQREFQSAIQSVDALRDENFLTTFPELAEMMETNN